MEIENWENLSKDEEKLRENNNYLFLWQNDKAFQIQICWEEKETAL